jgi:hypothetical protein
MKTKKTIKRRKQKTRRKGKNDNSTAWERLPKTPSGKQVKIQFYVDANQIERYKRAGMIASEMDKVLRGEGIIRNTPGMFCEDCCRRGAEYWEKMFEKIVIAEKEGKDAISSNSHNSR